MPTQKQIQSMLEKMTVKDLRILSAYFGLTKQSGGYQPKYKLIYNLVGGAAAQEIIWEGNLEKYAEACQSPLHRTVGIYKKYTDTCWENRYFIFRENTVTYYKTKVDYHKSAGAAAAASNRHFTITNINMICMYF